MNKLWRDYLHAMLLFIVWSGVVFSLAVVIAKFLRSYYGSELSPLVRWLLLFVFIMIITIGFGLLVSKPYQALQNERNHRKSARRAAGRR